MDGRRGIRVPGRRLAGICGLFGTLVAALAAGPARGFDYFDGKLEIHGYVSEQIRGLSKNLNLDNQLDLSQWYNVANLEVEAKPFPNGLGPIELLEFTVRAEARYDCVYTHACGLFPSVNTYGDQAKHLPPHLVNGDQAGYTGTLQNGDTRPYTNLNRDNFELSNRYAPQYTNDVPLRISSLPGFVSLFGNSLGPNEVFDPINFRTGDDPAPYYFQNILEKCKFGVINSRGGENGQVNDIIGPWNPGCHVTEIGAMRHLPNPFNRSDFIPVLAGVDRLPWTGDECANPRFVVPSALGCPGGKPSINPYGQGELPYRPAPFYVSGQTNAPATAAQGLFVPSSALVREMNSGKLSSIDQNFTQAELEWNHGASQEQTGELKEAYADMEMFDGRLWMRVGKQTIVWGKTELFRNTDQFNPQDLALASLPNLEESRIGLWSARGTWSFYNIGKLEDVRLELAVNFDHFQPTDLGRCGEPYTLEAVCGITLGYWAHGFSGAGLAGTEKPPPPWDNLSGLEEGARLEWRYKRFSFQLSDFYGYDDFPTATRISTYERNVDPNTGRPRRAGDHGPCVTGYEPACLGSPNAVLVDAQGYPLRIVASTPNGPPDTIVGRGDVLWKTGSLILLPGPKQDVLQNHSANQTTYALANIVCGSAGFQVDPSLCGFVSFNGHGGPGAVVNTIAQGASALFAGSSRAALAAYNNGFLCNLVVGTTFTKSPACRDALTSSLRLINLDPGDNIGPFSSGTDDVFQNPVQNPAFRSLSLGGALHPQQEALLGCGPFYQSDCDTDGIDLLNAEASVLIQSWPGFEGTRGSVDTYNLANRSIPQPGTVGFVGGPVATRSVGSSVLILPGARGPGQPGYNSTIDGCTGPGPYGCNAGDVVRVDTNGDGIPDTTITRQFSATPLSQPFTGQLFKSELAAVSSNFLMIIASGGTGPRNPLQPTISEFDVFDPYGTGIISNPNSPFFGQPRPGVNPAAVNGKTPVACGFYTPQLCENVRGFLSAIGVRRNSVRAGGANGFGRRDFAWDSSGELVLDYTKRNVLGFAFDFDEEHTKTNWGFESTWINRQAFADNNSFDDVALRSTFNTTISVDRPFFINFLNPGRTFFFNSQWFFQYITGYGQGFYSNGPFNVLATATIFTGYFQDRLMMYYTTVFDFNSSSGALLPSLSYRFTENFSATIALNVFFGHQQLRDAPINELRPTLDRVGRDANMDGVYTGLSALANRDEVSLVIRYTF